MAAVAPLAILIGAFAAVALVFASFWQPIFARLGTFGSRFAGDLEGAGMKVEPQQFVFILAGVAVASWVLLLVLFRPGVPGAARRAAAPRSRRRPRRG